MKERSETDKDVSNTARDLKLRFYKIYNLAVGWKEHTKFFNFLTENTDTLGHINQPFPFPYCTVKVKGISEINILKFAVTNARLAYFFREKKK